MANKTIKFFGNGYAPTGQSASVNVTFNGNSVYSGTVPSIASSFIDPLPDVQVEIFSIEIDDTYYGNASLTVQATAGDQVTFSWATVNSAADPTNFIMLAPLANDYRENVTIDGVPQSKGPLGDVLPGAWMWDIPANSTLACTMIITGGGPVVAWSDSQSYNQSTYVHDGSSIYAAEQAVPAGTPLTDTAYWIQLPGVWHS